VAALRAAAPRVQETRELYDQEFSARAIAHAVAKEVQSRYAGYASRFKSEVDALYRVRDDAQADYTRLEGDQKTLQQVWKDATLAVGGVQTKLAAIAKGRERYLNFVLDLEEQARDRLSDEVAGLRCA
jgi:acetoin utilization deacetylase AcuC-like enzyme